VYRNAIGLPPLASRPVRTALLSPVGPEGYLALGPHLTTPGAYPVHLVNPSTVRLEMLFDMHRCALCWQVAVNILPQCKQAPAGTAGQHFRCYPSPGCSANRRCRRCSWTLMGWPWPGCISRLVGKLVRLQGNPLSNAVVTAIMSVCNMQL
jgi:hypothetical protein